MKKILVANRGEIAIRVMKSARKMGIKTVAVYSTADRDALHVKMADEAVCVGPPPSAESYLVMDNILSAAIKTNSDGIHPGYGFLSENADFCNMVTDAGIKFIGPRPHAIEVMGSKLAAKDAVKDYDIPMVPGIDEAIEDVDEAIKIASEIGFPILIKASAGGGGKGMRVVENAASLPEQMERAISEAVSAFGDGSVFIEKYISSPRHIEIQVLADSHGNVVHLFERECSIQRRHQKVVEEAPSAVLTPELRAAMGQAAVKVAKACDYEGAGTVEFLLDEQMNFYFLEMNTRLQVEHPVTEMISGVDLVEQQIRVARGEKLSFAQEDLTIKGHSMELRIYAEDSLNGFLPSIGTLTKYIRPAGNGVRLDDGYDQGMEIPIYYDPMIAKLITYGDTRQDAIELMKKAIHDYEIEGIETTLPFGEFVFSHPAFVEGTFDTHFVKKFFTPETYHASKSDQRKVAALVAVSNYLQQKSKATQIAHSSDNWLQSRS